MKINYKGNYPIHAKQNGKQIMLFGGEKNIEVDELPEDMGWIEVVSKGDIEPKASKSRKTAKIKGE